MPKSKLVIYEFDPSNPPPLTEDQKAQLERLRSLPDEDIDTSDIPEADEDFWARAVRNPFFRPVKQQLTLRLDADLVAWFKAQSPDGRGYQTAINDALRHHVRRSQAGGG
jgi:uncharacterized protein (DUF4415 family)